MFNMHQPGQELHGMPLAVSLLTTDISKLSPIA